ncbi:hypothetical protein ACP70R_011695 [Stipagrostis hirtigluma subsp. patula]
MPWPPARRRPKPSAPPGAGRRSAWRTRKAEAAREPVHLELQASRFLSCAPALGISPASDY